MPNYVLLIMPNQGLANHANLISCSPGFAFGLFRRYRAFFALFLFFGFLGLLEFVGFGLFLLSQFLLDFFLFGGRVHGLGGAEDRRTALGRRRRRRFTALRGKWLRARR